MKNMTIKDSIKNMDPYALSCGLSLLIVASTLLFVGLIVLVVKIL